MFEWASYARQGEFARLKNGRCSLFSAGKEKPRVLNHWPVKRKSLFRLLSLGRIPALCLYSCPVLRQGRQLSWCLTHSLTPAHREFAEEICVRVRERERGKDEELLSLLSGLFLWWWNNSCVTSTDSHPGMDGRSEGEHILGQQGKGTTEKQFRQNMSWRKWVRVDVWKES